MTASQNFALYFAVLFSVTLPMFLLWGLAESEYLFTLVGGITLVASVAWIIYMIRLLPKR